jgi:large conductance mechanosensitive channel
MKKKPTEIGKAVIEKLEIPKKTVPLLEEFKKFALRGNMIDLAVGIIIGGAFNGIVSSLVNDIIMPVFSLVTGKLDFSNWFIALNGGEYDTYAQAQAAGAATINYGNFISGFINFIIMAFAVFLIVKLVNKISGKDVPAPVTTKDCPYCCSKIPINAVKCPFCVSELTEPTDVVENTAENTVEST